MLRLAGVATLLDLLPAWPLGRFGISLRGWSALWPNPNTTRTPESRSQEPRGARGGHAPSPPGPRLHQTSGYSSPDQPPLRSAADCSRRPEPRRRASEPWRHYSALATNSRLCLPPRHSWEPTVLSPAPHHPGPTTTPYTRPGSPSAQLSLNHRSAPLLPLSLRSPQPGSLSGPQSQPSLPPVPPSTPAPIAPAPPGSPRLQPGPARRRGSSTSSSRGPAPSFPAEAEHAGRRRPPHEPRLCKRLLARRSLDPGCPFRRRRRDWRRAAAGPAPPGNGLGVPARLLREPRACAASLLQGARTSNAALGSPCCPPPTGCSNPADGEPG